VLTALGVEVEADPPVLRRCLEEVGIAFLFAPRFHPALRSLAAVRRQLPFRTLFNLVGPLANPARPEYQLIGVPSPGLVSLFAQTIASLGAYPGGRIAVAHGADGMDEVTLGGDTRISWSGEAEHGFETQTWSPRDFDLEPVHLDQLRVAGPDESALKMRDLLAGEKSACRNVVLANAAAALLVSRKVTDLKTGVALAAQAIDRGDAWTLLERWARISQGRE
jgi:anthranilate phosphoribosyltransferase